MLLILLVRIFVTKRDVTRKQLIQCRVSPCIGYTQPKYIIYFRSNPNCLLFIPALPAPLSRRYSPIMAQEGPTQVSNTQNMGLNCRQLGVAA